MPAVLAEDCLQNFCDKRNTGQERILCILATILEPRFKGRIEVSLAKGCREVIGKTASRDWQSFFLDIAYES